MEEFLLHHCVTSDTTTANEQSTPSRWQATGRAECILVQENRQAHGASRVILSAMLSLTLKSARTSDVLLFTLDSPDVAEGMTASSKLSHVDYSDDADNFQASTISSSSSQLMSKMLRDIEQLEAKIEASNRRGATSARPVVVVLDSLNALLQQTSLPQVLLFLRKLHGRAAIGSVIMRLNASAELPAVGQTLAAQATAVVLVETRSSLRAYPLLSKERRREIPHGMHGFVLLVRQKKNGRSSESIEYFRAQGESVQFVAVADANYHPTDSKPAQKETNKKAAPPCKEEVELHTNSKSAHKPADSSLGSSGQAPLPVRQKDVPFNLSISSAEQQAKSQVQLPYMHQGHINSSSIVGIQRDKAGPAAGSALFFIDEDDPDWDDDDLDDDLDI